MGIKNRMKRSLMAGLVSVLILGSMQGSVYGQEVSELLTLEQLITRAMVKEDKVNVLNKKIDAYETTLNSVSNISGVGYYSAKYAYDQAVQEKELLKDSVAYNVTELYQNISLLQKQIELNVLDIELAQKELRVAEIKNKNGQLSALNLKQAEYALDNKEATKKQNELMLENYKSQLFTLTGVKLENYEQLEEVVAYESLGNDQSINSTITKNVDYYMKNTEAYVAYQQDHVVEILESKYGAGTGVTMEMWQSNKADLVQSSYTTEKQKEKMIESLKTNAMEIKKLEETIALQEEQIKNAKKEFSALEINYAKGYVSELEKKKAEQSIGQLELAKVQTLYTYTQLKMIFEKPWVKY